MRSKSIKLGGLLAGLWASCLWGCMETVAPPTGNPPGTISGSITHPGEDPLWKDVSEPVRETGLPRKVLVATVIHPFWEKPDSLDGVLDIVCNLIDEAASEASQVFPGRRIDLIVLPEGAVTMKGTSAKETSVPLEGPVLEQIGAKARAYETYIVLPMFRVEDPVKEIYSNIAVLIDRQGKVAGGYRKVHPVANLGSDLLEGGVQPGADYPVFDCDFGRLGMQICWDLSYEEGWRVLAEKGAEIVALPSESPQLTRPAYYASRGRYYVVSSTPRNNASIFNPAGMVEAQITDEGVLVHEIDLAFLILPWSANLRNGAAFAEHFGERVSFRYYESEDAGIFWSNDSQLSISAMARELGLVEFDWRIRRTQVLQNAERGAPPKLD